MNTPHEYEIKLLQELAIKLIAGAGDKWLPEVAARALNVSVGTMSRWHRLDIGPRVYVKFGQVFYDATEIMEYRRRGTYPRKKSVHPS